MESLHSVVLAMGNKSSATVVAGAVKGAVLRLREKKPFSVAYSTETEGMVASRFFFIISDSVLIIFIFSISLICFGEWKM